MRVLLLTFVLLLLGSIAQGQNSVADALADAAEYYRTGEYLEAIETYEAVLQQGVISADVYYNLGNSYFEYGDLGHALLNYHRAYELNPRDPDINLNIAVVRALRVDIQREESTLIDSIAVFTVGIVTTRELGWIVFAFWTVLFAMALVYMFRRGWRRSLFVPLILLTVITLIGITLFFGRVYVETYRPRGVVTAFETSAMSGPGEGYVPLFVIYPAAELRILDERNGWYQVIFPDDRQGWLPVNDVEKI